MDAGVLILVLLANLPGDSFASHGNPPNILLITIDNLRPDALGCYHGDLSGISSSTPNIDALARDGIVFTDAQSTSPSTHASAMSLLFGVHVPIHGVYDDGFGSPEAHFTHPMPRLLEESGYMTSLVGCPWLTLSHLEGRQPMYAETRLTESWMHLSYNEIATEAHNWIHDEARRSTTSMSGGGPKPPPWFLHVSLPGPNTLNISNNDNAEGQAMLEKSTEMHGLDYEPGDRARLPRLSREMAGWGPVHHDDASAFINDVSVNPNDDIIDADEIDKVAAAARRTHVRGTQALDSALGVLLNDLDNGVPFSGHEMTAGGRDTLVVFTALRGSPLCDHGLGCDLEGSEKRTDGGGGGATASSLVGASSLAVPLIFRWACAGKNLAAQPSTSSTSSSIVSLLDVHASLLEAGQVQLPVDAQGFSLLQFAERKEQTAAAASRGQELDRGTSASASAAKLGVTFSSPRVAVVASELWGGYALLTAQWKLCFYVDHNEGHLFFRRQRRQTNKAEGAWKLVGHDRWHDRYVSNSSGGSVSHGRRGEHNNLWGQSGGGIPQLQSSLLAALLRWRARQDSLSLLWSQMAAVGFGRAGDLGRMRGEGGGGKKAGGRRKKQQVKLNRNGKPRKARVVDSARAMVEAMRGTDAEVDLQTDVHAALTAACLGPT